MNKIIRADLHCHSHHSDGVFSPEILVAKAVAAEVDYFALTDHDTILGVESLCKAAKSYPIHIIKGVELSTRWKLHDIHILGLNIKIDKPVFLELLSKQNEQRAERAKQMANLLESLGVQDLYQKACKLAGHERIGRPHLAQVLINEGMVTNMSTAFKRYLSRGGLGYVASTWLNLQETISAINDAGGMAVIAHPLKYKLTRSKLHELIKEFKALGGAGLEVVSGDMNVTQVIALAGLCERFDLLASTGSDFHNDVYSRIKIGQQQLLPLNCRPIWEAFSIEKE
jgi:predicted metal-dependent phosphoesterase TrpH